MKKQYLFATCEVFDLSCADILTLSKLADDGTQAPASIKFEDLF